MLYWWQMLLSNVGANKNTNYMVRAWTILHSCPFALPGRAELGGTKVFNSQVAQAPSCNNIKHIQELLAIVLDPRLNHVNCP